jgi:hypothetical protein
METYEEEDKRLKAYAQEKVVAKLVASVKKETARQEVIDKASGHSPQAYEELKLSVKKWKKENNIK